MTDQFRWGILGTGNIASQFAEDLKALPDHELVSVGSRSVDRAIAFCERFGGAAVDSYDSVLDDPGIDAIYISLPNTLHAQWSRSALSAGHHVLCEKPLATSVAEARSMFAAAKKADRLLVEAFMYRCHPQTLAVLEAVRRGDIGQVTHIRTSFLYRTNTIDGNIRFDPDMAGGALMDVGCYCLDFSMLVGGAPIGRLHPIRREHERGVDVMTSAVAELANGVQASFVCGMDTHSDNAARISGTEGFLHISVPWKPRPDTAGYTLARGVPPRQDLASGEKPVAPKPEFFKVQSSLPLFALEARAFARAARGETEPFMTEADSIRLAQSLEAGRTS